MQLLSRDDILEHDYLNLSADGGVTWVRRWFVVFESGILSSYKTEQVLDSFDSLQTHLQTLSAWAAYRQFGFFTFHVFFNNNKKSLFNQIRIAPNPQQSLATLQQTHGHGELLSSFARK